MKKVRLQDLTWVEVRDRMQEGAVAIVPFGSQEQHGPQTPMGDFAICERVAVAVAETTGAVVAPVIPFGYSEYFKPYPGTISVRASTLDAVLDDYVDCLFSQGFDHIVFFNGHAGNTGLLDTLCRRIRAERGLRIPVVTPLAFFTADVKKQLYPDGGQGHGGAGMTALQLYLNPEAVRMDLAVPGKLHDFHGIKVKSLNQIDFHGAPVSIYFNYDEITDDSGVVGDGREATAEKGRAAFEMMVKGCTEFVEWFRSVPSRV
jgi:creatinine amidohydrolase